MQFNEIPELEIVGIHIRSFQEGYSGAVLKQIFNGCQKQICSTIKRVQRRESSLEIARGLKEKRILESEIRQCKERIEFLEGICKRIRESLTTNSMN